MRLYVSNSKIRKRSANGCGRANLGEMGKRVNTPKVEYRRNGAGDVYRKTGEMIETFYYGEWVHACPFKGSKKWRAERALESWNLSNVVPITEEQARELMVLSTEKRARLARYENG